MCVCVQARHFVREKVEAALESARRAIDAQEMACLPRYISHCLLWVSLRGFATITQVIAVIIDIIVIIIIIIIISIFIFIFF